MKRRLIYCSIFVLLIVGLFFYVIPSIETYSIEQGWTVSKTKTLIIAASYSITFLYSIFIIIEGRFYKIAQVEGIFMLFLPIFEIYRFSRFPEFIMEANILTFLSGAFIFVFGFVIIRNVIFKHRIGIYFILFAFVIVARFPVFIDVILMYVQKFSVLEHPYISYYKGVMVMYIVSLIPQVLALDGLIKENYETFRYKHQ